jgi:Na+/phosphate symporter
MSADLSAHRSQPNMKERMAPLRQWLLLAALLLGAVITTIHSYLLFHSLAELFSIVIAFGVFIVAWNSNAIVKNNYLLVLGIGSLFIALIDTLHMIGYAGSSLHAGHHGFDCPSFPASQCQ